MEFSDTVQAKETVLKDTKLMRTTILLIVPLALAACRDDATVADDPVRAVRTLVAEAADPVRTRAFPSILQPPEITPLAFDVGGRLGPLDLRVGQEVREGEVLATVEAVDASLGLQQAEAALTEAEVAAANAREEADRQIQLFERAVAAEAARDRAVTAAEQAEARVEQARRGLDLLRETLADTELRAPFDGLVNGIEVQAFGSVQPGQPIVTLYEDEGLQATIFVSYEVASQLTLGRSLAMVPSDGSDAPLPASVTEIARRAPAVSSFPVVVTLDARRPDLRSGMAVEVLMDLPVPEAETGIPLPLSALALDRGADFEAVPRAAEVFVYEGQPEAGRVDLRAVEIGAVVDDRAFVVGGVAPGERVVTAGVPFLHPGQAARLEGTSPPDAERAPGPLADADVTR